MNDVALISLIMDIRVSGFHILLKNPCMLVTLPAVAT